MDDNLSEYEKKRLATMAANAAIFEQLGLNKARDDMRPTAAPKAKRQKKEKLTGELLEMFIRLDKARGSKVSAPRLFLVGRGRDADVQGADGRAAERRRAQGSAEAVRGTRKREKRGHFRRLPGRSVMGVHLDDEHLEEFFTGIRNLFEELDVQGKGGRAEGLKLGRWTRAGRSSSRTSSTASCASRKARRELWPLGLLCRLNGEGPARAGAY